MGNILLGIMEGAEDGVMMLGIFCVPVTKRKISFICGMILFWGICSAEAIYGDDNMTVLTLRVFLSPAIWILWTDGKLIRRLAVYICSIMYLNLPYFCINLLFAEISSRSIETLESYEVYCVGRGILTIAVMGILAYNLRRMPGYQEMVSNLETKYFLIGSICTFAASIVQHSIEDIAREYENMKIVNWIIGCMIIVSMMFYALGVGSVVLDIFRKKYKEESGLKDEYLQITRDYVKVIRNNAQETRKMRHDIQSHMGILKYYMEQNEYQKAKAYLLDMHDHMEQSICKIVSVNHEIVDAILMEAQFKGEEKQIRWGIEGALPHSLSIGDFDMCTIFSNLLSNSIEACEKVEIEKRYIHLEIRHLKNNLLIELENPVNESVELEKLGSTTSKMDKENHGYGISNVREVVEKNHGEISFENKEGIFAVTIIFDLGKTI